MDRTAQEILAITNATELFTGNPAAIKTAFRRLAQVWHPDHNSGPNAGAVLQHLTQLRDMALKGDIAPTPPKERVFATLTGKAFRLRFLATRTIEAGHVFVGRTLVAYLIDPANTDLVDKAMAFKPAYEDDKMRLEIERFLPHFERRIDTVDGPLVIFKRTPDQFLLADLIDHLGGQIDPVHVAWMISGMENIGAWLTYAGVTHGAIDSATLLVSPKYHSVALTGLFLYQTVVGERPSALPGRTLDEVPRMALAGVPADSTIDLELIRLTAREALGEASGAGLLHRKDIPSSVAMWLMTPPAADGFADYASWERARTGFGKRSFVEMTLSRGPYDA